MNNILSIDEFLMESGFTQDQINEALNYLNSEDPAVLEAWYNTILDFAALVPGIGSVAQGINLVSYANQGEYLLAALCAIGLIPIFGQYIGAGGTFLVKALKTGAGIGGAILKPLVGLVAKFFPRIVAFFKSAKFSSKFSGISPFIGKMIEALKNFVMTGGKDLVALSKNPAGLRQLKGTARKLSFGGKALNWLFGGDEENNKPIPVPQEVYAYSGGNNLKNIRPYTNMEISQAEYNRDWSSYL